MASEPTSPPSKSSSNPSAKPKAAPKPGAATSAVEQQNPAPSASTLAELRASGWKSQTVKDEIRANAVAKIRAGEPLFQGVLGYEDTVLPQMENAILAGHDIILLGERGQAKTRMIRSMTALLDEWMPIVAGSEINDDPYNPSSRHAKDLLAEHGENTPITWVHRSGRYGEKLATPDTSISDLIGEVDPIKVAEGRYLSDELTLHYGLVPRTNRGIFAINELPDLSERIQVGLLNVLEERDVQIRGYKIRLPIDVVLVASANPEDYTNRGRIITPLKDRFGAQIRTHYPLETSIERLVIAQEAMPPAGGIEVRVPEFMAEIVATFSQIARQSPNVNQRSGVSVRLSVANYETLCAAAVRRALRGEETLAVPRVSDLDSLMASTQGKIEVESIDEREGSVVAKLMKAAVLTVFKEQCRIEDLRAVLVGFESGMIMHAGDDITSAAYAQALNTADAEPMREAVRKLVGAKASPQEQASAAEFVLEGLHLSKRLNKDSAGSKATYRGR